MKFSFEGSKPALKELDATLSRIQSYVPEFKEKAGSGFDGKDSFINIPFDYKGFGAIENTLREVFVEGVKYIFVVGIGGSSLGSKAVYDMVFGYLDNVSPKRFPKIIFIENTDLEKINLVVKNLLDAFVIPEEYLLLIVSKSGKTFEIIKNIKKLDKALKVRKDMGQRALVLSTDGSPLQTWARQKDIKFIQLPSEISGRFQIFTGVGLIPLKACGLNILEYLEGGMSSVKSIESPLDSLSVNLAAHIFEHLKNGKDILVNFVFDPRLESLAKWQCSIISESLGKESKGITPLVGVGSKDLHSLGQLLYEGPKDKFTVFVSMSGSDPDNLLILDAVKESYLENDMPFCEIQLEKTLVDTGALMQSWLLATVFLGYLMNISPYDQPGVERYKKLLPPMEEI